MVAFPDPRMWLDNGGASTLLSYKHPLSGDLDHAALQHDMDWFRGLPRYHEDAARVYVHAGVHPAYDLIDQPEAYTQWFRYPEGYDSGYRGKMVVHGHTPNVFQGKQRVCLDAGRKGLFVSCSGYPACKYARPLGDDNGAREPAVLTDYPCDRCGKPLAIRTGRRGKFFGCSGFPACRNVKDIGPDGAPVEGSGSANAAPEAGVACEQCGKPMIVRRGKRGAFLGCSGYPKCRSTQPVPPELRDKLAEAMPPPVVTDEKCEECGAPLVLRMGRRGQFLGCSKYPKCRFTREYEPADTTSP
jgi:ssDNA-binding Zn-finger/Zn-ribbon topoisomerase 1